MDETVVISMEKTIGYTPVLEAYFGETLMESCEFCEHGIMVHVGDVTGESRHPELIALACLACAAEKGQPQSICYMVSAERREAIGWRGDS